MTRESPQAVGLSRRRFLAAGGATVTAAVAGCAGVVDWLANQVLEQVNLFNYTDQTVDGSVTVVGPDGETRLDESFTLAGNSGGNDESDAGTYGDVWSGTGSYEVSVELDKAVNGVSSASETVTIDDTGDQLLVVAIGSGDVDETIAFGVGDGLTDALPAVEGEQ
jgi:hypothetical protein